MFFLFGVSKVPQLERIINDINQNLSNNYKDEARKGVKDLEEQLQRLGTAGRLKERQKAYYETVLTEYRKKMEGYSHLDQKPYW